MLLLSVLKFAKVQLMGNCSGFNHRRAYLEEQLLEFNDTCVSPLVVNGICAGKSSYATLKLRDMNLMKPLATARPCFQFVMQPTKINSAIEDGFRIDALHSMVVAVKSHWSNFDMRVFARESWASYKFFRGTVLRVFFVVGYPPNESQRQLLKKENDEYGDILQLDISETYNDVGMKTLGSMQWAAENFPRHWIFASCDDDIVPNLRELYISIKKHWFQGVNESSPVSSIQFPILCNYHLQRHQKPIRVGDSVKNTVSRDLYPVDLYPTFCSGGFYTMSVAVSKVLFRLSRSHMYFFNDDVWITGLLRLAAIDAGYLPCRDISLESCGISTIPNPSVKHYRGNLKRMKKQWNFVKRVMQIH